MPGTTQGAQWLQSFLLAQPRELKFINSFYLLSFSSFLWGTVTNFIQQPHEVNFPFALFWPKKCQLAAPGEEQYKNERLVI